MRKLTLALLSVLALAGCGGGNSTPPSKVALQTAVNSAVCPVAVNGNGHIGVCAPSQPDVSNTRAAIHAASERGPIYPDLSNNDPCVCGTSLKAKGYKGLIVKANQGTGFIDSWAVPMVASARAAGLPVGAYDFDQDYTVAEAKTFVARLHAAGIYPGTPNTFPAYLDVEFGNFSYSGLLAQIAYLHSQGYRVGIYTGEWYWGPHAGSRWPAGVTAWISGYPFAPPVPGLPDALYNAHQFTDTPIDLTVFRGPLAYATFVNATPPPAPPTGKWRAERDAAFRLYRAHQCRYPQQDNQCRHIGAGIEAVQRQLWTVYPKWALFGKHESHLHSAIAWVVRPEAAYWSHAAQASGKAYTLNGCGGIATFGTPLHTPLCRKLDQRARWFGSRAHALVQHYS